RPPRPAARVARGRRARVGGVVPVPRPTAPRRVPPRRRGRAVAARRGPAGDRVDDRPAPAAHRATRGPRPPGRRRRPPPRPLVRAAPPGGAPMSTLAQVLAVAAGVLHVGVGVVEAFFFHRPWAQEFLLRKRLSPPEVGLWAFNVA